MLRDAITVQETHNILAPEIGVQEMIYNMVLADPYGWLIVGFLTVCVAHVLFLDWLDHRNK